MTTLQEITTAFVKVKRPLFDRTQNAGALLRMVQFRLTSEDELSESDTEDLSTVVDLCVGFLPNHQEDVNDALNGVYMQCADALKTEATRSNHLAAILNATQIVARLDSTCEELGAAARTVFEIAQADGAYEPDWRTLRETIEARGVFVDVITTNGFPPYPRVVTKEGRKAARRTDRVVKQLVAATCEQDALSKHVPRIG